MGLPQIGHLLYSDENKLGLVTEVVYLLNKDMYFIAVQWCIKPSGTLIINEEKLIYISLSSYKRMRERYYSLLQE